jgi:hypothetical protein
MGDATMELREIEKKLPCGKTVKLRELTVEQLELIASEFGEDQVQMQQRALANASVAAAIIEIDGKPIDHATWSPREEFPRSPDWSALRSSFQELSGLQEQATALFQSAKAQDGSMTVTLPSSGRRVTLRMLDEEEIEKLERDGKYAATDWQRLRNDRAALAIASVDGQAINRETFKARLEFPTASDWNVLSSIAEAMTQEDPDFFREPIRRFLPGGGKSPGSAGMGTSQQSSSSGNGRIAASGGSSSA